MSSTSPMPEPTQLQKQFDKYFKQAMDKPLPSDKALLAAWIERRKLRTWDGLADLQRDLAEERPRELLVTLKESVCEVLKPKRGVAENLPEQTGRWVTPMLLVVAERLLQNELPKSDGEVLHLHLDKATVASIVGACLLDRGVYLAPDAQTGDLRALNVLCDMPALEYGFRTSADVARAEVLAALDAWHHGGTMQHRKAQLARMRERGASPPSPETVRLELEAFEREHGVRLSFGAPAADVPAPLLDEDARAQLRAIGVETFFFGKEADGADARGDVDTWFDMSVDLEYYVDAIVNPFLGDMGSIVAEPKPRRTASPMRNHIFISYSHDERDTRWKNELLTHLHTFDRSLIDVWVDTAIGAGKDWEEEIRAAMARARVGVFLVSSNFLSSKFITTVEVPTLIARQQSDGMEIMPILVRDCTWKRVPWLNAMQIRPGSTPLATHDNPDAALAAIATEIDDMCNPSP